MVNEASLLAQLDALLMAIDGLDMHMEKAATAAAAVAARLRSVTDATLKTIPAGTVHNNKHRAWPGNRAALTTSHRVLAKEKATPLNNTQFRLPLTLVLLQEFIESLEQTPRSPTAWQGLPLGQLLGHDGENTQNSGSSHTSAAPAGSSIVHPLMPLLSLKRKLHQLRCEESLRCSNLLPGQKSLAPTAVSGELAGAEGARAMKSANPGANGGNPNNSASAPLSVNEPKNCPQASSVADLLQKASQLTRNLPAFIHVVSLYRGVLRQPSGRLILSDGPYLAFTMLMPG
ncbi:hypothetical protein Emed_000087 [Eimeria media]